MYECAHHHVKQKLKNISQVSYEYHNKLLRLMIIRNIPLFGYFPKFQNK